MFWGAKGLGCRLQAMEGGEGCKGREGRKLQDVGWLEGFGSPEPPPTNSEQGSKGGVGFGRIFRKEFVFFFNS